MNYFLLVDSDGENAGILKTDANEDMVKRGWEEYYNSDTEEVGIDEFIEKMAEKFPFNFFERFFLDQTIQP